MHSHKDTPYYGVSFGSANFDQSSTFVIVALYALSFYVESRYIENLEHPFSFARPATSKKEQEHSAWWSL